jgi:hypothetical protein
MKKSILCTLLAVLLICFLTACVSEAPSDPPIAPPETTTGVSDPEETTGEPQETTAEETTTAETTAEITTESPETTEENIVCRTEWGKDYTSYIVYLNPLTTVASDFGSTDEPVEVADTETPWYITEWETYAALEKPEVPEEKKNYAFRVPLIYEGICNKMYVKIEFFQEYYLIGEPMQVRITVENRSKTDLFYTSLVYEYPATILKNGDAWGQRESEMLGTIDLSLMSTDAFYGHPDHVYHKDLYHCFDDVPVGMVLPPKGKYDSTNTPQGAQTGGFHKFYEGIAVLEYSMTYDPTKLILEDTYTFDFFWNAGIFQTTSTDGTQYYRGNYIYRLPVPLEIVEVALVPAQ